MASRSEGSDPLEAGFFSRVGWVLPPRRPNLLAERCARQDRTFPALATWCFDHPDRLEPLRSWAADEARDRPGPRTWELLGYLEYLCGQWSAAARAFMRSLEVEPENLDAWVDLAFSLKHAGLPLGDAILFDHDLWIHLASQRRGPLTLATLSRLKVEVEASGQSLAATSLERVAPYLEALQRERREGEEGPGGPPS